MDQFPVVLMDVDYPLLAIGMAWLAILGMLALGGAVELWRRLRGTQQPALCAAKPVCETGALAGWSGHPAGCSNVERLRGKP